MEQQIRKSYSDLVDDLASTAKTWLNEKDYNYTIEEAVNRTLDDQFIWDEDKMVIIANAYSNGIIEWGQPVDWDAIHNDLFDSILEEVKKIK